MKLSEYAKKKGISYSTAKRWFHAGLIAGAHKSKSGSLFVEEHVTPSKDEKDKKYVTYARVSNQSRKAELEYQVTRISEFCKANGYTVTKSYKEVASGMNDKRREFWKMIDSKPDVIVVENKDRLTRFGFEYIKRLLEKQGIVIIVMNESETDEQDLIKDLVSIITSFCCRLYGLRRGKNKAKELKKKIETDTEVVKEE